MIYKLVLSIDFCRLRRLVRNTNISSEKRFLCVWAFSFLIFFLFETLTLCTFLAEYTFVDIGDRIVSMANQVLQCKKRYLVPTDAVDQYFGLSSQHIIYLVCLNINNSYLFLKKWAILGLFFVYFRSFSNKHQYNFTTN